MRRFVALLFLVTAPLGAQSIALTAGELADSALPRTMPRVARAILAADTSAPTTDRARDDRYQVLIVAGDYARALAAGDSLHAQRVAMWPARLDLRAANVWSMLYVRARVLEGQGISFDSALAQAYAERVAPLDDKTNALVLRVIGLSPSLFDDEIPRAARQQQGHDSISRAGAIALVRSYLQWSAIHEMAPHLARLMNADDARRYAIAFDTLVRVPNGQSICAVIVRGRTLPAKSTTIMRFTIYVDSATDLREARRTASNGYVAVAGYSRGKACSPGSAMPYVYDGDDAASLITWIARQPWSDGRVGMYSGSYEGFTQWAATKHLPAALKTIMTGAPAFPGIDVPMEGNVVWNFIYPWPFYAVYTKTLDTATYNDYQRFRKAQREWYVSGRAYRDLDKIDGTPNPVFDDWVDHPSYDAYWQHMVPQREELAKLSIPVLQTLGYYYGGPGAAVPYYLRHMSARPNAEHYLVMGPWSHFQAQTGVVNSLGDTSTFIAGYETDPVSRIDIVAELRYQWFDYVFHHGPRPALLQDRVNYQVTGANVWKHAPSIAAMSKERVRYFLSGERSGNGLTLRPARAENDSAVTLTVDLKDRTDIDSIIPGGGVRDNAVSTHTGVMFVSAPLAHATELSGLFGGHLEVITNKKDFDFTVELFELTADGSYYQIPPFQSRASHVRSLTERHLLTPGKREVLDFSAIRVASRQMAAGSRLVAVISVIKNPGQEINYGAGGIVARETVADAGDPVRIRILPGSYVEIPVTEGGN